MNTSDYDKEIQSNFNDKTKYAVITHDRNDKFAD